MRRKFLSVVLCVCMMMTMVPFAFAAETTEGSETWTDSVTTQPDGYSIDESTKTVSISSAEGLAWFAKQINSTSAKLTGDDAGFKNYTINIDNDINLSGRVWIPIDAETVNLNGKSDRSDCFNNNLLAGAVINGNGHTISNMTIHNTVRGPMAGHENAPGDGQSCYYYSGFIGRVSTDLTIENLNFTNASVDGHNEPLISTQGSSGLGVVVGLHGGGTLTISDVSVTDSSVSGYTKLGGLVGFDTASLTLVRCSVDNCKINLESFTIDGEEAIPSFAGSIVGFKASKYPVTNGIKSNGNVFTLADSFKTYSRTDLSGNPLYYYTDGDWNLIYIDGIYMASYAGGGNSYITIEDKEQKEYGFAQSMVAEVNGWQYSSLENAIAAAEDSDTVTLLRDITLSGEKDAFINIAKSITLDGAGHKISGYGVRGDNYAKDTVVINYNGTGSVDVTLKNLTIENTADTDGNSNFYAKAIETRGDTEDSLTLNNVKAYTKGAGNVMTLCVGGSSKKTITLQNSELISTNSGYPVITYVPITMNTTDSKINGYCGVYFKGGSDGSDVTCQNTKLDAPNVQSGNNDAQNDFGVFTLEDDNITIDLTDCEINAEAKNTARQAVVLASENAVQPANGFTVTVQGDKTKVNSDSFCTIQPNWTATDKIKVAISGGLFTSDPSDYCADNLTGVPSGNSTYPWTVGTKSATKADVAAGEPAVNNPDVTYTDGSAEKTLLDNAQTALTTTTPAVAGTGIDTAAATAANNNTVTANDEVVTKLKDNDATATIENTNIVIQTYMDMTITGVNATADKKSISVEIQPMYRTVATTADVNNGGKIVLTAADNKSVNAVQIGSPQKLNVSGPVTLSIPLPDNFASGNAYVQHKGYEYTATVDSNNIATFVNPHGFSSFTITADRTAVAEVNGTSYINFQDAVDAVENGGTIEALQNIDSTVSGNKSFKVNENGKTVKLTAASGYNLTKNDTGVYTVSRQSSGSGSASTTYNVTVNAATNGTVAADKKTAAKGTTVTITATPSTGYVVDAVKVVDKDGKDVAVTAKDGKYVFTMPASAVTVTASFKAETPAPSGLPFVDVKSGDWFYDAVKYAYEQGLMTGTSATTFAPNGTMNRAMIVTVLYRLEKSPAVTAPAKFADVPTGQWYSDAVAWAAANNIVNGYNETTFGPMNAVTREQMAAILYRYEQYKGMDTVTLEENLSRFPDQDKVSAYAVPAMQWAVGQKVINGNADGTLNPTGTATRAQVAQIFTNLLNK